MEMIVMTTHIVKPSSPTPHRFKNHKLSTLDRITPSIYNPLIFFYENNESKHDHEEISRRLKHSLSEILTIFYPLAGKIKQNSFVDCDDRGVEFVEARVHARLAQLIQNPNLEKLKQLVPLDTSSSYADNAFQLLVKTSYFDCGGIAVGVCLSHKLADVASFATFMNAWAATCRGEGSRIIHPSFDLALHFPPTELSSVSECHNFITKDKITTKRMVFESKKIAKLRQEASLAVKNPSRVEAVSAFIWRNIIEAAKAKSSGGKWSSAAGHAVNMRPRTVPPTPENCFGNCAAGAVAVMSSEEDDGGSGVLVSKLRAAIRAVDNDYIEKEIKDEKSLVALYKGGGVGDIFKAGNCNFTSRCRFPVYDVDFGWGKPVWVCVTAMPSRNQVILMDTGPSGDGMEAWINIPDDHFFQMLQTNFNKLDI